MGEFLPFMRSRLDSRYLTLDLEAPLQRMPSAYIGANVLVTLLLKRLAAMRT
jgi:2,3-dihydroxybenzoate decarboxylase